ncbi:murein hydrolase activator EnvC [Pleionea sp. CnH1-48]|uniref:murein hydrolase activator EnvC family protein n=1 Tax=Pleionea sp. CnH1-48 TaxID=2954494 RepID=UPI002097F562|nr:peptidoglycan DD-metalloendopeptidase family protein [Pleionea sp. CnH1-48]MCO7225178.1 peptidoglycan DD-metalloendopeptidase family protein [Pleionea sp. CnH1-48]
MISPAFVFAAEEKQTREELEQVKKQIQSVQKRLGKKRKQYDAAVVSVKKSEQQISSAAKILRSTQRQIKKERKLLTEQKSKQRRLRKQRDEHQVLLMRQLRAAYLNGHQEYVKLLLNQQQPEKLGRVLVYYDYLNKARTKTIMQLGNTISELLVVEQDIQKRLAELNVLEASQKEEKSRLLGLKKKRQVAVKKLSSSISSQGKRLARLRENEVELESLLNQMRKALEEILQQQSLSGLKSVKGRLSWPVKGKVTTRFGQKSSQGLKSNGIQITAPEGREVAAVYHGQVVFADWLRGFGLMTIVDHGDGYMSLYGNNQSLFKEVGDWVEAGELIATVGQSGGHNVSGLYFEIRHQGQAKNPLRWVRR